jgi:hypothetical protein
MTGYGSKSFKIGETMVRAGLVLGVWLAVGAGTAGYQAGAQVTSVKVSPEAATVAIGETLKLKAEGVGSGKFDKSVKWMGVAPAGWTGSAGSVSPQSDGTAVYESPYPAPPSVTLVATSAADEKVSAKIAITLVAPKPAVGPALTVDGSKTHPISELIYGMNDFAQDPALAEMVKLPVGRWGGDAATPYNWKLDVTNSGADWYFETIPNKNTQYPEKGEVNSLIEKDMRTHAATIVTVPLIGWTTLRKKGCAFPVSKYPEQEKIEPYTKACGNGRSADGKKELEPIDPHELNMEIDEKWASEWVRFLTKKYGDAAHGGVGIYELDNEPEYWPGVHRDVHPKNMTYDEVTEKGLTYAKAVKDADPTAAVMGPVISNWTDFFYSWTDMQNGWHTGPCYCATGAPKDRLAHGDVPLMEYYLNAFRKYDAEHGVRLLDYLDIHAYFAAKGSEFHGAGDTRMQEARLNSTRVFWDATYIDPESKDPDDRTKSAKPVAPRIIPLMHSWVEKSYPGTKTAITEYAYGGQEHINGAITQADVLGIFGREGLDLATLWGTPDPKKEMPGVAGFMIYRNYDGKGGRFGETGLAAASEDQGRLAVYAATRKSDGATTVIVLNKTYGELKSAVALSGVRAGSSAKVFRYSSEDLSGIKAAADAAVTAGRIEAVFPAQSMTLFVVEGK